MPFGDDKATRAKRVQLVLVLEGAAVVPCAGVKNSIAGSSPVGMGPGIASLCRLSAASRVTSTVRGRFVVVEVTRNTFRVTYN
jgi:hypothetical protein